MPWTHFLLLMCKHKQCPPLSTLSVLAFAVVAVIFHRRLISLMKAEVAGLLLDADGARIILHLHSPFSHFFLLEFLNGRGTRGS